MLWNVWKTVLFGRDTLLGVLDTSVTWTGAMVLHVNINIEIDPIIHSKNVQFVFLSLYPNIIRGRCYVTRGKTGKRNATETELWVSAINPTLPYFLFL